MGDADERILFRHEYHQARNRWREYAYLLVSATVACLCQGRRLVHGR